MSLLPNKKQWNTWSLPSKLTAIGVLLGFLSLSLYLVEKTFNIIEWVSQDDPRATVSVDVQFPYERIDGSVQQNKRNPELTVTNRSSNTISPIKVDVIMYALSPSLDEISSAAILNFRTHGHLIFEPELKPGSSVKARLPGIKDWVQPAAYKVSIETIIPQNKKMPILKLIFMIDKKGIKLEGSQLSKEEVQKISTAILAFEKNPDVRKKATLNAPIDGVWVPHAEPDATLHLNEDGTLTVK